MSLINLNLLKLRALARKKAGVSVSDYSNSLLDDQLNIAYVKLARLLANLGEDYFEEQNVKFNLIARSGLYSLPVDFMAWKGLRLAFSGTPVANSAYTVAVSYDPSGVHNIASQEANIPISNPIVDITGNYFRIQPKPTQDVTRGGSLDYICMPSALAATADIPVIPVDYHDKLAVYAAAEMAFTFEKWNKHTRLQNEWSQTMSELELRAADRDLNFPLMFKAPQEAGMVHRVREL